MRNVVLPFFGWIFIRTLHSTLRVRHINAEKLTGTKQYIIAFWHAHLLMMLHSKFARPITVLSSKSRDGELIARVFNYYRVHVVRGSSSSGGVAAVRGLIRAARSRSNIVFTPDGPTGPARVAKEGIVVAAQATGLPIIPIAFAAKKKSCCSRGTGWLFRGRSRGRSSSTVTRSSSRATATSRSGVGGWKRR